MRLVFGLFMFETVILTNPNVNEKKLLNTVFRD